MPPFQNWTLDRKRTKWLGHQGVSMLKILWWALSVGTWFGVSVLVFSMLGIQAVAPISKRTSPGQLRLQVRSRRMGCIARKFRAQVGRTATEIVGRLDISISPRILSSHPGEGAIAKIVRRVFEVGGERLPSIWKRERAWLFPFQVNKMKIFKNTPYWNQRLWECKQFIEIRPITFPHGEPTEGDVNYTTILSNGECVVDKNLKLDEGQLTVKAEDDLTSFPRGYVPSKLLSKWHGGKNIQEDDVWGMKNMSTFWFGRLWTVDSTVFWLWS